MKYGAKIFIRYVSSAAGIALLLVAVNFTVLFFWLLQSKNDAPLRLSIAEIAASITRTEQGFAITQEGEEVFRDNYAWAMILNESGEVIWNKNLPDDLPREYSLKDVAIFSRWYYRDYPTYIWDHPDGLLVLGRFPDSTWKHAIEMPINVIGSLPIWVGFVIVLNLVVAFLLALTFGWRMFRSIRPLIHGIDDLSNRKSVDLAVTGILGDLAEKLNQTSKRLTEQDTALQKRDNARLNWISGISHDIRTPLSMVMGYASQLEENNQLPAEERKKAEIVRVQSEKIKKLVNDLNLASRLEYEMQPLRISSMNPAELVRKVVAEKINSGLASRYTIEVDVVEPAESVRIMADEILIQRAITNLLENSIEHNPDGCSICVKILADKKSYRIKVIDDGIGLPASIHPSNAQIPDASQITRAGIGISIVQQIMKSSGGYLQYGKRGNSGCEAELVFLLKSRPH